jgi:hypothetical protein
MKLYCDLPLWQLGIRLGSTTPRFDHEGLIYGAHRSGERRILDTHLLARSVSLGDAGIANNTVAS